MFSFVLEIMCNLPVIKLENINLLLPIAFDNYAKNFGNYAYLPNTKARQKQ